MLDGQKAPGQGRGQDCCSAGTQLAAGMSYAAAQLQSGAHQVPFRKGSGQENSFFGAKRDQIAVKSLEKASYPC